MTKYHIYLVILLLVLLSAGILVYALRDNKVLIEQYSSLGRVAKIHPDYCETAVPPNIAPLNFLVQEEGSYYCVKIYSKQDKPIEVFSRTPKIMIPEKPWHELLNMNRGQELCFDIYVRNQANQWTHFETITNRIANEDIDNYLVYRKIHPVYSGYREMGIYQRDLRNYDESPVLENGYFQLGCLNCHTFCNNRTDKMLIGIRSRKYGSSVALLLVENGIVNKIGLISASTSWHPSGRLVAYSVNKVRQFFHFSAKEVRDVVDLDSLLAYYIVESKTVKTSPKISNKDRLESYPAWSADGRYLYFCSAPVLWSDRDTIPPEHYDQVRYDLVRVSYDIDRDQWGELETILSAQDTGLSILLPRPSPDGRWLLFVMCDYGWFPLYRPNSDLYIMDLKAAEQTGQYQYRRLEINSDQSESWHSWSSNSRWIAFSSKKETGLFTRVYLSYVDEQGKAYKALLLPQKDPAFYDSCIKTYNLPELVTEAVQVTGEKLARAIRSSRQVQVEMPITMATPKAGAAPSAEPWLGDRE
jgi:hypothetical protein